MSIGQKIKQLRLDKQITQEELANYLGIAYQSVSKWETGITMPDISYLYEVAERYNKYGMYDEAIVLFEKHAILNAPYLDSRYSLAFIYDKLHHYEKAIEMWEIILNGLRDDFNLIDGEEVNWPKREIEKLKLKVT